MINLSTYGFEKTLPKFFTSGCLIVHRDSHATESTCQTSAITASGYLRFSRGHLEAPEL